MRIRSLTDLPTQIRAQIDAGLLKVAKPSKYRSQAVAVDGERFDSRLEYRCWQWLKLRQAAGEVAYIMRQVSIPIEGGRYIVDFLVGLVSGATEFIEAKGYDVPAGRRKRRQMRERYGVEVKLWRGEQ